MSWYKLDDGRLYKADGVVDGPGYQIDETTPHDQPVHGWTWHDGDLAAIAYLTPGGMVTPADIVTEQLIAATGADLAAGLSTIAKLQTLLGDAETAGSYRALIGPAGATAGTGSLRAVAAKVATDGTVAKLAASMSALIGLLIDSARLDMDTAQALRRTARQVQRLAKVAAKDLDSAAVGTE